MKKIFLFSFLLVALASGAQTTVRDANAVARSAKAFHAIEISDGIDLFLSQGTEEAVAVSASSDEYRDKIRVEVENGVLKIYYAENNLYRYNWNNRKMKAYVTVKSIDRLSARGGADIRFENALRVASFALSISGGSDFRGSIQTQQFDLHASGGSDTYVSGTADNVSIHASGGSDVHAYELAAGTCVVNSSGGSDVKITANKSLTANSSGGSDIYYKGTATVTSVKSGGGSIHKSN